MHSKKCPLGKGPDPSICEDCDYGVNLYCMIDKERKTINPEKQDDNTRVKVIVIVILTSLVLIICSIIPIFLDLGNPMFIIMLDLSILALGIMGLGEVLKKSKT